MEIKEMNIEAPWGQIAVKLWGNPDNKAILTIHGIMDNAGSFDNLIPLLPKSYYICIDLPGHGKSTPFPPFLPIVSVNYILVYKIVADYFKYSTYVIMGHSYGGQLGLLFSQMYPERVEKLIMLDTVHLYTVPVQMFQTYLDDKLTTSLDIAQKLKERAAPRYTYEEALNKLIRMRPSPLSEKAARCLLKRTLIPVGDDKYELSIDQRLKNFMNPLHDSNYAIETLKKSPVKCPALIIFGIDNQIQRNILKTILDHLKKQSNFTVKYVPGHHDVHQNDPEVVAPIISRFLNGIKSKL